MCIIPGFGLAIEDANMRMELSVPSQSSQVQWGLQIQQIITINLCLEETYFSFGHQLTPTVWRYFAKLLGIADMDKATPVENQVPITLFDRICFSVAFSKIPFVLGILLAVLTVILQLFFSCMKWWCTCTRRWGRKSDSFLFLSNPEFSLWVYVHWHVQGFLPVE